MLLLTLVTIANLLRGTTAQAVDENGVSLADKTLHFERLILNPFGLNSIVEPCSKLFDGDPKSGETTSAEWVRIVFHDFATADVAAGKGYEDPLAVGKVLLTSIVVWMHLSVLSLTERRILAFTS